MNPIEQITQSSGAASSQALAGLFGAVGAGKAPGNAQASEGTVAAFAAALGAVQPAPQVAPAAKTAPVASAAASTQPQDYIAAFGALIPAQPTPQVAELSISSGINPVAQVSDSFVNTGSNIADLSADTVKVQLNGLAFDPIPTAATGIPAPTNTAPIAPNAGTAPLVNGMAAPATGHFLPLAELTALTAGVPESVNVTAAPTGTPSANPVGPVDLPASTVISPEPVANGMNMAPAADAAQAAPSDVPAQPGVSPDLLAQAAAQSGQQQAAEVQQDASAAKTPENLAAEGHIVPNTAANPATQQPGAKKPGAEGQTAKTDSASALKSGLNSGLKDETGAGIKAAAEALTNRAIDPALPRTEPQLAPQREAALALTPERLVGLPQGSASEAIASGLSGLRGDSSFSQTMTGLMGGRPSPTFAAQISQQFNLQVTKSVSAGEQEFTMRLDPAELGRVQVRMQFSHDGQVRAHVLVEKPETLELLQRDARGFEKALEAGGQKIEQGGISFGLENNNRESAGRAFAEGLQQEKMQDALAKGPANTGASFDSAGEQAIPLDDILPYVTVDTGIDVRV